MRARRGKVLLVCAAVILLLMLAVHWAFFNIQRIHWQEMIDETTSADGRYTVTAYLTNGGATTACGVLCGVRDNTTGRERKIYWQYRCETAQMSWVDGDTIIINGVMLDVPGDTYDYRHPQGTKNEN